MANKTKPDPDKLRSLSKIMGKACALVDLAWPRDSSNISPMPREAELLLIGIQDRAAEALGLPEGLGLMTGDPMIDLN